MARLEEQLAQLSALDFTSSGLPGVLVHEALRKAVASKSNLVLAKAAGMIAEHGLDDLTDDLVAAFDQLMKNPGRSDKGGSGLTALARALALLGYQDAGLFRRGSHHVQMESAYGGKVDVADHLRGWCAQGLAQSGDPDAMVDVARLLVDPCSQTRKAAAQGVEISGRGDIGLPLLNMKITQGDPDPQVISQCVTAMLALVDSSALELISPILKSNDDDLVEQVLLALGQSRQAAAFEVIETFYEQCLTEPLQKASLLAMAMLRSEVSMAHLENLVEEGNLVEAQQAIEALGIYNYDSDLKTRLLSICEKRDDIEWVELIQRVFL